ncbi:histidine kinase internal region [Gemmatirosa kalamazoonensis]|uniref:Histidine kinase internal region n=1 Tax=Gemmatirosa kalamazoonensis TaxID=861299 RepID=W0RFZ9_9BACT|nr:histidine kinase [Gemmatirosa kalamazoonensis]AHG89362.1 histidine kinase internal region [Gemmatirosa kalamazoonensis]
MSPFPSLRWPRWPAAAQRRALLWAAGWVAYGAALAGLRLALDRAPAPVAARWVLPTALALALAWIALTPVVARVDLAVRRARLPWRPTLLLHGALALAAWLVLSIVRRGVLAALLPAAPRYWPLAVAEVDLDLGTYALMLALLRAVTTHRELVRRTRRALQLETELARARLDYLQRQLRPHFLFNALNAIAQLARDAPTTSANMMRHLAELLRAATVATDVPEVTVRDELATLASYVAIERLRFGDRLDITQRVDPAAWSALLPPLLLQPLVENAVRHGLRHGGRVHVDVAVVGETLRVTVENGAAEQASPDVSMGASMTSTGGHGIGLPNTRARLAQLYGARYGLALGTDATGRTTVTIELPWHDVPEREVAELDDPAGPPDPTGLTGEHPVPPQRPAPNVPLLWPAVIGVGAVWTAQDLARLALRPAVTGVAGAAPGGDRIVVAVMLVAALVAWGYARGVRAWYSERALASARLEREIERTRLQSLTLDVRPPFILWLLDRAARVVVSDPPRGERIAERTADLLRMLLDASGRTRLTPDEERALAAMTDELRALATIERCSATGG